ncbi:MAG: hypothetical protein Q9217_000235 [Psora testacea]
MPPPFHQQRYLSLPGLNCCRVSISPFHKVSHEASRILDDPTHVLYPLMQRRYKNVLDRRRHREQKGLWVVVTGNTMGKTCKSVVRNWARRRLEHALAEQLKERGYDGRGRNLKNTLAPISSTGSSGSHDVRHVVSDNAGSPSLCGTVTIQLLEKIKETKYPEVQRQAGLVADEVLRRCRQNTAKALAS